MSDKAEMEIKQEGESRPEEMEKEKEVVEENTKIADEKVEENITNNDAENGSTKEKSDIISSDENSSDGAITSDQKAPVSLGRLPPILASGQHPLDCGWTIWFDKKAPAGNPQSEASYRDSLKKLGNFYTLEEFWSYYGRLARPKEMHRDTNYHVFRENVLPTWESFPKGGCWILRVRKSTGLGGRFWEDLLFALIGETFEEPDIVGVELSIRAKEDLLSLWVKENRNYKLGEKWMEMTTVDGKLFPVEYKAHQFSIRDHSTYKNTSRAYAFAASKAASIQPSLKGTMANKPAEQSNTSPPRNASDSS